MQKFEEIFFSLLKTIIQWAKKLLASWSNECRPNKHLCCFTFILLVNIKNINQHSCLNFSGMSDFFAELDFFFFPELNFFFSELNFNKIFIHSLLLPHIVEFQLYVDNGYVCWNHSVKISWLYGIYYKECYFFGNCVLYIFYISKMCNRHHTQGYSLPSFPGQQWSNIYQRANGHNLI